MKNLIKFFPIVLLMTSCLKMNDNIQEYLDRGEVNYIGKVDSAFALSGKERILFKWKLNADPRVEKCTIYWNNYRDSAVFRISDLALDEAGYVSTILPFPEGKYICYMYHSGSTGHRSVREEVVGSSYGTLFEQSLTNRILLSKIYDGKDLTLNWFTSDNTVTGVLVTYNGDKTCVVDPLETETVLEDFDPRQPLSYRTEHLPEQCFDKFLAPMVETMVDPNTLIPRSTWTGTASSIFVDDETYGPLSALDGDLASFWGSNNIAFPHWVAYDMKRVIVVKQVFITMRELAPNMTFKDFMIQGSMDGVAWTDYPPANGSPYYFFQPVGLLRQTFILEDTPEMQHIRISCINSHGASMPLAIIAEFEVFGAYK